MTLVVASYVAGPWAEDELIPCYPAACAHGTERPRAGRPDFTVGSGGALPGSIGLIKPNRERRIAGVAGVLKLDLSRKGYSWQFVPVLGEAEADAGSAGCHGVD